MAWSDRFTPMSDKNKRFQFGWHWRQPQEESYWILDTEKDQCLLSLDGDVINKSDKEQFQALVEFMNGLIE